MRKSELDNLRGKKLSRRELEVLLGLASGFTAQQLADRRGVAVTTIKEQRVVVIRKLGARNSVHAVALGFRRGLLRWPSERVT